jgi:hypothetical protein
MKRLVIPLALAAVALATPFAFAQMSPSMQAAMPKCASGDQVVALNATTKTYWTMAEVKAKTASMTAAQKQAMMTKNHVKLVCKSQADAMGAKMAKPPM